MQDPTAASGQQSGFQRFRVADILRYSVRFGQLLAHDAKAATPPPAPTLPPHPTILYSPFDVGPPDAVLV